MDSREVPSAPPSISSPLTQALSHSRTSGMLTVHNSYVSSSLYNNNSTSIVTPNSTMMIPNDSLSCNPSIISSVELKPLVAMNSIPFGDPSDALRPCVFSMESSSSGKKKRGRPRKYGSDGNISLALSPIPIPSSGPDDSGNLVSSDPPVKRQRGRPPGSGKKQLNALGTAGVGFTPHVIMVNAGEDVASKIMAFSQEGPRTICILSANGAICNVTLRQPALSGGTVSYEGRFEIISLSGSFLLPQSDGNCTRMGGISVSLAGSDGRVLGGGVAGTLMAATPVHVVVGSFIADGKKSSSNPSKATPPSASQAQMMNFAAQPASTSPHVLMSESSDDNGNSPHNHGSGAFSNSNKPFQGMPMYSHVPWPNSAMKILQN